MKEEVILEQLNVIRQLRKQGYAVCIFTPEELQCSTPEKVEDAMCEAGWHQIDLDLP